MAGELVRVGHAGAAGGNAVRIAGAEDGHAVAEGALDGLDGAAIGRDNLHAGELYVDGQVHQAFLHAGCHVLYQHLGLGTVLHVRSTCTGPQPVLTVADVQVEAVAGQVHGVLGTVGEVTLGLDLNVRGIRSEDHRQAGRTAYLRILALSETLVLHRIHTVIRVGSRQDLADHREVRSLGHHLRIQRQAHDHHQKEEQFFHTRKFTKNSVRKVGKTHGLTPRRT